ncbi:MAG TPA: response regulator [Blastocatellia bacterium]|nr:response regulator [Blastocatellia bacterium]
MLKSYSLSVENELVPVGQLHLLVGDNDSEFVRAITETLERHDMTVAVASNGEEIYDWLQAETFDGVLLDVELPGVSGRDILGELRRQMPDGLLILMASSGSRELFTSLMREGAMKHLPQPSRREDFLRAFSPLQREAIVWLVTRDRVLTEWLRYILGSLGVRVLVFVSLGDAIGALSALRCNGVVLHQEGRGLTESLLFLREIDPRAAYIFLRRNENVEEAVSSHSAVPSVLTMAKPFNPGNLVQLLTLWRDRTVTRLLATGCQGDHT